MTEAVTIERRGSAAWVTLNRPDRMNALGVAVVDGLYASLHALASDVATRAIVLTGAGDRAFCTGADLKERAAMSQSEARAFVDRLRGLMDLVGAMPQPTIAAINGFAFGGGLELALACDLRYAAAEAQLGLTEVRLGIVPGAGGTQRLPRIVGEARARELILTGRRITGVAAEQIGLVHESVAAPYLAPRVAEVVAEIELGAPIALREAKRAIDGGSGRPLREALGAERAAYEVVLTTHDRREALSAFAEKRPPRFEGR